MLLITNKQHFHATCHYLEAFIVLMKDALEHEKEDGSFTYDRFITMTDGMIPTKSKAQLVEYLEEYEDKDIYYEVDNSDENEEVKKRFENYAFLY